MDDFLTPVSTTYKASTDSIENVTISSEKVLTSAKSPSEALQILQSEPDAASLRGVLLFLMQQNEASSFIITSPTALSSQIVNILVTEIVPNYWAALTEESKILSGKATSRKSALTRDLLLSCLRSVMGVNAVLLSMRRYIQHHKERKNEIGGSKAIEMLQILLDLLATLLDGETTVKNLWVGMVSSNQSPQSEKALWSEYLSLLGSGNVINISAEVAFVLDSSSKKITTSPWLANSAEYSRWVGANILSWIGNLPEEPQLDYKRVAEILSKSLRFGQPNLILCDIYAHMIQGDLESSKYVFLVRHLSSHVQKLLVDTSLKFAADRYLSSQSETENTEWWQSDAVKVAAVAQFISVIISPDARWKDQLAAWLTKLSGAGMGNAIGIRRSVVVVLASSNNTLETALESSFQQFGDKLYIAHTPSLQQEVFTQALLLAAGYVHRRSPLKLSMLARSGIYLNAISNRLAASSPRARFLGMIVGEAISNLTEKGDKRMTFKVEEMNTSEAEWYKSLVHVTDSIGSSMDLLRSDKIVQISSSFKLQNKKQKAAQPSKAGASSNITAIEELSASNGESDDDDLKPYAKPDADEEDSDDDPTLVQRDKPTAPVYIRDLIAYLRDTDNYDRQKLALTSAAPLIRRKASFGTEVSAHAEEVATLLVGLQDKYDLEDFQKMRQEAMVSILIAQPLEMSQWFARTFFEGDYSIQQRAMVLATLGLGARELGGFKAEDSATLATQTLSDNFPSKRLPPKMHAIYGGGGGGGEASRKKQHQQRQQLTPIDALSSQLSRAMMQPMAAGLADRLTGPDVLKVRTFSSRMAVEARRARPAANGLARVVAAGGFFFPLTGRYWVHLRSRRGGGGGGGGAGARLSASPFLVATYLRTLSLILHAAGPASPSLPQMTREFWDLLLDLRAGGNSSDGAGDAGVAEALLLGFLTLLEANKDNLRVLAEQHSRQLVETQGWVQAVFEGIGAGEEEDKVKMLAAGVLVRIREVVEKYQALLMGELVPFGR